jgi:hypothetical protein
MSRIAPWAGWIGGIAGWFISQQIGSGFSQLDCRRVDLTPMLVIGAVGAGLAIGGGLISWRAYRGAVGADLVPTSRFIAATSSLAASIFLLAILFQTLAALIIPQCHA